MKNVLLYLFDFATTQLYLLIVAWGCCQNYAVKKNQKNIFVTAHNWNLE